MEIPDSSPLTPSPQSVGVELTEDDVDDALKIADKTGNGVIDYDEFIQFVLLDLEGEGRSSSQAAPSKDPGDFSIPAGSSAAGEAAPSRPSATARMRKAAHVSIRGGPLESDGGPSAAAGAADDAADGVSHGESAPRASTVVFSGGEMSGADDRPPPLRVGLPGVVNDDDEPLPGLRAALLADGPQPPAEAAAAAAAGGVWVGKIGGRGSDPEQGVHEGRERLPASPPRAGPTGPSSPRSKQPVRSALKKRPSPPEANPPPGFGRS